MRARGASSTRSKYRIVRVRPAWLRAQHAAREPGGQHDLHLVVGHGAAPQAPRHRALAGVRRLVGLDALARLRAGAPVAGDRAGAARHLHAARLGDPLVLPARRERDLPGPVRGLRSAASRNASAATWSTRSTAASPAATARRDSRPPRPGPSGRARRATCTSTKRPSKSWDADEFAIAVARIECHYFVNKGFFKREDQLLRGVEEDPAHPGGDRAGALRRRLPDAQRLGPAPGLARGGPAHRAGRGPFGARARQHARTGVGHRSLRALKRATRHSASSRRSTRSARSRAIASRSTSSSRSLASSCDSLEAEVARQLERLRGDHFLVGAVDRILDVVVRPRIPAAYCARRRTARAGRCGPW